MKLKDYIKDKVISIFVFAIVLILLSFILVVMDINKLLIIYILFILFICYLIVCLYEFYRRKKFFCTLEKDLYNLSDKYFITEIIKKPNFLEGELFYDYLNIINKSMIEKINSYKYETEEFKDYIELWCHEIKTPIATGKMIYENNKNTTTESINDEINKIDTLVEQVLYFARSEVVEKDYIIKKTSLKKVVNDVIKKNKKQLITKKIKVDISTIDNYVNSDEKWLEFIINQIVVNSIKYANVKPYIKISSIENRNNIILSIYDNGIGIVESEIEKVFDKCFTGTNGRNKYNSTGIGLYLCKKLCIKLGHNIIIESKEKEYTKVSIVFPKNSMIDTSLTEM